MIQKLILKLDVLYARKKWIRGKKFLMMKEYQHFFLVGDQ